MPAECKDRVMIQKLQFVNPQNMDKFGDAVTVVCEVQLKKQKKEKKPRHTEPVPVEKEPEEDKS